MIKFNPKNKEELTYRECLSPIFEITDKDEAMQYKADYIAFVQRGIDAEPRDDNMTAEYIVNSNIGYYAGYGSMNDRLRIEELFECAHPVFGSIKNMGAPSSHEALNCGIANITLEELRKK